MEKWKKYISEVHDFPQKGIIFKDLNPIYKNPKLWKELMLPIEKIIKDSEIDFIAGIESRGFISASALAYKLEKGFLPIRKSNKLPGKILGIDYQLEYGTDRLEIQADSIIENSNIIILDDLIATGGTASAAEKLIKDSGANLFGYYFLIELTKLKGREKLDQSLTIESLIKY
tara:strand:- start:2914 stop:3432 length:519 start_codon:yes stop_codon:yes gene_type:complete